MLLRTKSLRLRRADEDWTLFNRYGQVYCSVAAGRTFAIGFSELFTGSHRDSVVDDLKKTHTHRQISMYFSTLFQFYIVAVVIKIFLEHYTNGMDINHHARVLAHDFHLHHHHY